MIRQAAFAVVVVASSVAQAHTRSESWSHWRSDGASLRAVITVPAREVTRLPVTSSDPAINAVRFAEYVRTRISARGADGVCTTPTAGAIAARAGFVKIEVSLVCAGSPVHIEYNVLFDLAPGHVHFARFGDNLGNETLLTAGRQRIDLSAPLQSDGTLGRFVALGVRHIASGYDHLAFLLGLLLVAGQWQRIVLAATGFTLGHSLTLGIAIAGLVQPDTAVVEALIGFTIALVAAEYAMLQGHQTKLIPRAATAIAVAVGAAAFVYGAIGVAQFSVYLGAAGFAYCYLRLSSELAAKSRRGLLLAFVALAFGLIHGFGFAGFLIDTGLASRSIFKPLLGFNVGVEIGQIAAVSAAALLAAVYRRFRPDRYDNLAGGLLMSILCGVGIYWFVSRSLDSVL